MVFIINGEWFLDISRRSIQYDNRMAKVQEVLLEKYNKDKYGIYIEQLNTQTVAGINIDRSIILQVLQN